MIETKGIHTFIWIVCLIGWAWNLYNGKMTDSLIFLALLQIASLRKDLAMRDVQFVLKEDPYEGP